MIYPRRKDTRAAVAEEWRMENWRMENAVKVVLPNERERDKAAQLNNTDQPNPTNPKKGDCQANKIGFISKRKPKKGKFQSGAGSTSPPLYQVGARSQLTTASFSTNCDDPSLTTAKCFLIGRKMGRAVGQGEKRPRREIVKRKRLSKKS